MKKLLWLIAFVFLIESQTFPRIIVECLLTTSQYSKYNSGPMFRRHPLLTRMILFSSTIEKESRRKKTANKQQQSLDDVIFQKVVRPPPDLPDVLFLGYLIEYIQDKFDFPSKLPMVYEKHIPENSNDSNNDLRYTVVRWDSPLSPSSDKTCMNVKIVGIVTDQNDGAKNSVPSMAMLVVYKKKIMTSPTSPGKPFPPMLEGLFKDSEKKILKHLDRGLEEFMLGKIKFDFSDSSLNSRQSRRETYELMLAEIEQDDDNYENETSLKKKPKSEQLKSIDADIIEKNSFSMTDDKAPMESHEEKRSASKRYIQQREAALKTMKPIMDKPEKNLSNSANGLDFAIQAAKQAASKRKQRKVEDFAVAAAKKIQAQRSSKKIKNAHLSAENLIPDSIGNSKSRSDKKEMSKPRVDQEQFDFSSARSPLLDPRVSGVPRAFMTTISSPKDYLKSSSKSVRSKKQTVPHTLATESTKRLQTNANNFTDYTLPEVDSQSNETNGSHQHANYNKDSSIEVQPKMESRIPSNEMLVKSAQEALSEMAEAGKDMSAEELLADIMKFGEQQDKKQATGTGFVTGAFEKAKDILREQRAFKEQKRFEQIPDVVALDMKDDTTIMNSVKELSQEEELSRMFEAGERIAENRMELTLETSTSKSASIKTGTKVANDDIDRIIESDKTVSKYGRILDDELVELQVRINKSPDEVFDGPHKNPMFDIFSGPEVYDRNVDPEAAINWPGARPGTKVIRLPRELDVAVKQAKFAAELLMSIKEDNVSVDGTNSATFKVGDRELTKNQIRNLRAVVEEAVEIGLIDNPLDIVAEKARLQMLLDELWDQPEERFRDIVLNFKDLLLSDYFVSLVKVRLNEMADRDLDALRKDDTSLEGIHAKERDLLGQIIVYAQLLVKESRAFGAELEVQQLEIIRSICKVAMDPSHQTEEQAAIALTDAVRDMRPLFDDAFVAYLKYAVAEEEGRLARAGLLHDSEHNQWLHVLKIVQQGVYAELAKGINRYIEHIWYVLRMETPRERRRLLEKLIEVMPTLDVRPFVQVVNNIVGSLGDGVKGDFDEITPLGEMTNKLLQLHRDVKELLPPERIAKKSRDADEWVARQKKRLLEHRNVTKQRLKASQETEHLEAEIESFGKRGEVDRFD